MLYSVFSPPRPAALSNPGWPEPWRRLKREACDLAGIVPLRPAGGLRRQILVGSVAPGAFSPLATSGRQADRLANGALP